MRIYIDGACKGNGKAENIGGWGFVVVQNGECLLNETGINHNTTNNREELMGLIKALEFSVKLGAKEITIVTDSQYVKNGMTQWLDSWISKNWINSQKKPVKNQDLWKRLLFIRDMLTINFEWVKGHNGDKFNEMVDEYINNHIKTYTNGR